jgi:hypothetical protein
MKEPIGRARESRAMLSEPAALSEELVDLVALERDCGG